MKQILYILLILLLSVGCAQKPAAPKGNNNYPVSSPSSRPGSFSNNGRPPLPHQQKGTSQTNKTSDVGNTTNGRVLSPSEIFENYHLLYLRFISLLGIRDSKVLASSYLVMVLQ